MINRNHQAFGNSRRTKAKSEASKFKIEMQFVTIFISNHCEILI